MARRKKKKALTRKPNIYKRLLGLLAHYKGRMILAVFITFVGCALYALAPLTLGFSIDAMTKLLTEGNNNQYLHDFVFFLGAMIACYLSYALCSYVANLLIISGSQNAIYKLRERIDHKLSHLPLNYYDTTTYGDILARTTNDVEVISQAFQQCIFEILKAFFTMTIVLIFMICINPWLTLIGLLSIPILIFLAGKITNKSQKFFDGQMKTTGKLNGFVEEYYSAHNVVSLFGKEDEVDKNFEDYNHELFHNATNGQFLAGTLYPLTLASNNLGFVFVCFAGALMSIFAGLSLGMIQAFTQYLSQFSTPINSVMELVPVIQTSGASGRRIFEFLEEEEEIPDCENPQFPDPLKGAVEFDHVRFGYLPHQTLISDLHVNIPAGSKTAIVGPTGAGKTTLVNLIMRFYDVKGGAIRIDGVDIRDMKRTDLRRIFGMVLQDTWLYSDTIMNNIRYGKQDATDEEVIAAAKEVHADAFIDALPGTYDFILQEGAANIAQGQRQLLTIARALLSNPPIMILDEATSSVDTRTEAQIQAAMNTMMKGRTSFVIAHRLSTIRDADNIMYMQDGDILEMGTHDELMKKDGLYAKLYNSQFADE